MNDAELLELCEKATPPKFPMRDWHQVERSELDLLAAARTAIPRLLREKQECHRLLRGWLDANAIQFPKAKGPGEPGSLYAETVAALKEPKT